MIVRKSVCGNRIVNILPLARKFNTSSTQGSLFEAKSSKATSTTSSRIPTNRELWDLLNTLFSTWKTPLSKPKFFQPTDDFTQKEPSTSLFQANNNNDDNNEMITQLTGLVDKSPSVSTSISAIPQSLEASKLGLFSLLDDPKRSSRVLYWKCGTLKVEKSDLTSLLKPVSQASLEEKLLLGASISGNDIEATDFKIYYRRDPKSLIRWNGCFLEFGTRAAAEKFIIDTAGLELGGYLLSFEFVSEDKSGIYPPLLYEIPGITRNMCVLVSGLPSKFSRVTMGRALENFELMRNRDQAIIKLSGDSYLNKSSWLVRCCSAEEAQRLRRTYHRKVWPFTDLTPSVEILD